MDLERAPHLAAALLAAQAGRASGVLDVDAEGVHTYLSFSDGALVFAEQGSLGDSLGRVLVREGRLTQDQFALAIGRMTRKLIDDSEEIRFGEAVLELGFLSIEDITNALAAQVRHKVVRCLMCEAPRWSFRQDSEVSSVGQFPARIEPQILAAALRFEDQRIDRILGTEGRRLYPALKADADAIAITFEMKPEEASFVHSVDGSQPLDEVITHASAAQGLRGSAILAALVLAGMLELRAYPPLKPGPVRKGPPPLPVAPAQPKVEADPFPEKAPNPMRVPTPFDPFAPAPPDPRAARLLAEDAFQKGRIHLDNQELDRALPELRRAAFYCPDSAEYLLYARWAEFRAAPTNDPETSAERREDLRRVAAKAVKQDPNLGFGFFVLGQLSMLDREDPTRAVRFFQHALRLDPTLLEAEKFLLLARARVQKR
jgi:hypothetical protein